MSKGSVVDKKCCVRKLLVEVKNSNRGYETALGLNGFGKIARHLHPGVTEMATNHEQSGECFPADPFAWLLP
ncbi:hypothetical protein ZHAS_00017310 [Anopheles sinensis]|uniref:Uncharacterized protein n=1 Tax=Anopheles sinensis TaxID=74873 RepID=A0A084WG10_ANOSI|nr:hypothetical protein ZHAS_00017310 [Anopheles sinensis]